MRANLQKYIYISILFVLIGNPAYALTNFAKATIVVLDESNNPVEGAYTGITFEKNTSQGTKVTTEDGSTDSIGKFTATGSCNGHIAYGAKKAGYYDSYYTYDFKGKNTFGWEPWNPELKVILRKIENPVPMYARHAKIELPVSEKDVGFDLVEYDWVIPYGKGKYSDFIFNLKRDFTAWNEQNTELMIKLSNEYDGIILHEVNRRVGSVFKLDRYAPDINLKNELKLVINAHNGVWKTNVKNTDNYYFRIRSQKKDGKFYQSMYGKILGHLDFSPVNSKTAIIVFKYYVNPDYTRNLEFDPKRNLFDNISDLERVTEP